MSTTNRELADRAQQIAIESRAEVTRTAARCVSVALACSPSIAVARASLGELGRPGVREAALALLGQLAGDTPGQGNLRKDQRQGNLPASIETR